MSPVVKVCKPCGFPHYDLFGRLVHACERPHRTGQDAIDCSVQMAAKHAAGCECHDCKVAAWWAALSRLDGAT